MIPLEIQATVATALVVALISALQILNLRRAKQDFSRRMQELSDVSKEKHASCGMKKCCPISKWSLALQFIFGIIAFTLLFFWAFFLVKEGLLGTALFSGVFAVIGLGTPIYVWMNCRQNAKAMERLIQEIENRPKTQAVQEKPQAVEIDPPVAQIKEVRKESAVAATTVAEMAPPVTGIKPVPVAKAVSPEPVRKAPIASVPEDSMLRRHYLTHIESQNRSGLSARPTDLMLRRHYDTHMASLQQPALKQQPAIKSQAAAPIVAAETWVETIATKSHAACKKSGLPQDSMLRRHYLAMLRSKIASGLPPRPTDSILKRHFDGWKHYLIEGEIDKYLSELGA